MFISTSLVVDTFPLMSDDEDVFEEENDDQDDEGKMKFIMVCLKDCRIHYISPKYSKNYNL